MSTETTSEMLPKGWTSSSLGEIVKPRYGKSLDKSKRKESGIYPVVGSAGVMTFTDEPLITGEVIVVGRKGNVGDVQIFKEGVWPIDTVYYFEQPSNLDIDYFFFALISQEMKKLDSSTATPSLRREDLEAVRINIPLLDEQIKIVEILEEQFSHLNAALESVRAVREKTARFRRSLLHAAFTGALSGHDASMGPLPKGWEESTMGEIGRYLNGFAFSSKTWSRIGRPIIRIQNLTGSGSDYNYFDGEIDERYIVREGDLLFSWAATLGVYIWRGPEALLNQHIFKVESKIDKSFHRALIEHKTAEMMQQTHGTGMVHITKKKFDAIPVLVPPGKEQERIVQMLEEQLSRLDASLAFVDVIESKATALRRSLLHAAFTGDLTKEWREGAHV
jgi:restriction endonuclease S subunit